MSESQKDLISSIAADKIVELDVRPILAQGGEPFQAIMSAIGKTPHDGALKLRVSFKPVPLFRVLQSQGWHHWVESGADDDWTVWFYEAEANAPKQTVSESEVRLAHLLKDHPELQKRLSEKDDAWQLDVRRLSPPEPMELTLIVIESLPAGATLIQINERVPQFLLPVLEERGFQYQLLSSNESEVSLKIQKRRS